MTPITKQFLQTFIGGLSITAVSGCALMPKASLQSQLAKGGYQVGPTVDDISSFRINGFNVIDDTHVVLDTGPSSRYLVSLRTRCTMLPFATRIGFTSTPSNRLTRLDSLIVADRPGVQRCPINQIQKLDKLKSDPKKSDWT